MRALIIGDIHGCNKTFEAMLDKIALSTFDNLYLLGDYIDRGPDSKGVLDTIFRLKKEGYNITCLRGNHEQMCLDSLAYTKSSAMWMRNGGNETLASFAHSGYEKSPHSQSKESERDYISQQYIAFMESLPYYIETEDLILVHAGLNFKSEDPFEDTDEMIWIRDWYETINYKWLGDRTIVHGHTPINRGRIESMFENIENKRVLNIDCGAVYAMRSRHDCFLTCLDWTNRTLHFQKPIE